MDISKLVFDDLFTSFRDKLYSKPSHFTDVIIFQLFIKEAEPAHKENTNKNLDEIFYEYLYFIKNQTNKNYLILALKFIILFRECLLRGKEKLQQENEPNLSDSEMINKAPEYCNEFVTDFLETNDYFGVQLEADRNEFIELIQHFCNWLYMNSYTQSKLSRIA